MSEKSHVGMGHHVCPICYEKHDEVVLLDRRLLPTLERDSFLGVKLCEACKALEAEYVALVAISNDYTGKMTVEKARPTGTVVRVRRSVWQDIFDLPCPALAFVYCTQEMADKLAPAAAEAKSEGVRK